MTLVMLTCPICGGAVATSDAPPSARCTDCGKAWAYLLTQEHGKRREVYASDGAQTYYLGDWPPMRLHVETGLIDANKQKAAGRHRV